MDEPGAWRRARREFIRTHHPDRGGDPAHFAAGLAEFDRADQPLPPVQVVPDRPALLALLLLLRKRLIRPTRAPRVH